MNITNTIYLLSIVAIIIYIITILGVINLDKIIPYDVLYDVFFISHIIICLYLLYKFNPIYKTDFSPQMDTPLIFSSSVFLLTNVLLTKYISNISFQIPK